MEQMKQISVYMQTGMYAREHVAKKPSVLEQLKAPCRSGSAKRHRETETR